MVKHISQLEDGILKEKLGVTLKANLSGEEKQQIFSQITKKYAKTLLGLLEVSVTSFDQVPFQEQKKLGISGSGKDWFVTVDEDDKEIGVELRVLCHNGKNTNNKIHRASDWIVINESGELLMSQRTLSKDTFPLYWELGGGHVDGFETYEETLRRELDEELCITATDIAQVEPLFKFLHKDSDQHQMIQVFSVHIKNTENIQINDDEIERKSFFTSENILQNITEILEGKDTEILMIPHQIYCILIYFKKIGKDVESLLKKYHIWVAQNPDLQRFAILREFHGSNI